MLKTMKVKFFISLFSLLFILFLYPSVSSAQSPSENPKKAMRQERVENRCKAIANKIDAQINRFTISKEKKEAQYKRIEGRIRERLEKAKSKGVDTSKLESDIAMLDTKIEKLKTDFDALIAKLNNVKQINCINQKQPFKSAVQLIREQLKIVRQDRQDILNFYKTTIKPDLKTMHDQLQAKKPSSAK